MREEEGDEVWVGVVGYEYTAVDFPAVIYEDLEDFWDCGLANCVGADFSTLG